MWNGLKEAMDQTATTVLGKRQKQEFGLMKTGMRC